MTKTRLVTVLLTVALTLSMAAVVTAQEETTPWDPVEVPEFQQDEAFAAYLLFEGQMEAAGVPEEDMAAATDWVASQTANLSQKDVEELLAAQLLASRDRDDGE